MGIAIEHFNDAFDDLTPAGSQTKIWIDFGELGGVWAATRCRAWVNKPDARTCPVYVVAAISNSVPPGSQVFETEFGHVPTRPKRTQYHRLWKNTTDEQAFKQTYANKPKSEHRQQNHRANANEAIPLLVSNWAKEDDSIRRTCTLKDPFPNDTTGKWPVTLATIVANWKRLGYDDYFSKPIQRHTWQKFAHDLHNDKIKDFQRLNPNCATDCMKTNTPAWRVNNFGFDRIAVWGGGIESVVPGIKLLPSVYGGKLCVL